MTLVDLLGDTKPSAGVVAEKGFRRDSDSDDVLAGLETTSGTTTGNGDDTERDLQEQRKKKG